MFIRETMPNVHARVFSIQSWNIYHADVHDSFKEFYTKLQGSVNRHAPLKKADSSGNQIKK